MKSCTHFHHGCAGCSGSHTVLHEATRFFSRIGVPGFTCVTGSRRGWRTRAKLAVRNQDGLAIGLFARGTHTVISMPHCSAHHPSLNRALELLRLHFKGFSGYDEPSHQGLLRYVQPCVERRSGRVQLTLVLTKRSDEVERIALALYESDLSFWHSIWINIQPERTNTIFGLEWRRVCGPQFVWEELCGIQIPFLPNHFGQANLEMFERLLRDLCRLIPKKSHVVELFAGMGVMSLVLRSHVSSMRAVEREPLAQEAFQEAKERLPYPLQKNLEFQVADAMTSSDVLVGADTVIVDPPRKGLSLELIDTLCATKGLQRLAYISCHFPSFERDAECLMKRGFTIDFARSYLFFPGTDQIETLALFVKKSLGERI